MSINIITSTPTTELLPNLPSLKTLKASHLLPSFLDISSSLYSPTLTSKVQVISLIGPARTGKSLLLNLLLNKHVFKVSQSTNPCTFGVDAYYDSSCNILFLDFEGLFSTQRGQAKRDSELLCLAVLVSNLLVFNSFGVITASLLDNLMSIGLVVKRFFKGKKKLYLPSLLFLLKDFIFTEGFSETEYLK
jgi:hypothetical protein